MSLEPKTRIEYFLDGIVNDHDVFDPVTRAEMFLADIKLGNVARLEPATRVELFLAKISGADVSIPTPQTRIELYLAKIAGEDIEVPTPVTREETWLAEWAESGGGSWITVTGVSPLALANALAKPIKSLTQYGKCVQNGTPTPVVPADILCNNGAIKARHQSGLPLGYTLLAYARSAGTQYIDLGYKGNGNTKAEVKYKYYEASTATGSGRVFGSRIAAQEDAFAFGTSAGIVAATETNKVFWCFDSQPYFVNNENFGLNVWKTIVFSAKEHSIDGASVGDDYNIVEFETPQNLKLFGFDQGGTVGVGYADVEYCKLWDNGVLVRDLVPAKNASNVVGMYDFVSGQFLTNAGTGDFVAGDPVDDPVEIYAGGTPEVLTVGGQNLADLTAVTDGYYYDPNGVYSAAPSARMTDYIPVRAGITYTVATTGVQGSSNVRYNLFDAQQNWLSQSVDVARAGATLTKSIEPAQDGFLRVSANYTGNSYIDWSVFQVVQGAYTAETMPPYQPYAAPQTASVVNLFAVGDHADTQGIIDGAVTRKVGVEVWDGTESFTTMSTPGAFRFGFQPRGAAGTNPICTHYPAATINLNVANMPDQTIKGHATAANSFYLKDSRFSTEDELKAWLADEYAAGTPVIVLYALEESYTEQVAGQPLNTVAGTTIVDAQTNVNPVNLSVEYATTT